MQTVSFARILGTFLCFSKESTASIYFCVLWLEIKKRVFANFTHIFHGTTHIRVAVLLIVGIIALTQKWVMNDGGEECTMDYSDIYVERIRKLCNERGIAINKLATMSDVKQSTLDNIVRGITKNPGIKTMHKIALAFNMTLSEFLDFDKLNEYSFEDDAD